MTSKKTTRRALLSSLLSLLLCCSMLLGTTFAWFTDSVASTGNIIKSGTLDVEMLWSDTEDGTYKDASEGAIFDYKFWEPGYTDVKYIDVQNVGDLAFQYQMRVIPNDLAAEGTKLAEVIDVYCAIVEDGSATDFGFVAPTRTGAATDFGSLVKLGTLKDMMANPNGVDDGVLLPADGKGAVDIAAVSGEKYVGNVKVCMALHMQESAGNEYQDLSIGNGFKVELIAAQMTYEKDSFDELYDQNAQWPVVASGSGSMDTTAEGSNHFKVVIRDLNDTSGNPNNKVATALVHKDSVEETTDVVTINISSAKTNPNVTVLDGQTAKTYEITATGLKAGNTEPVKVELYVGALNGPVTLYHNEDPVAGAVYNPSTGYIIFETTSFSPFTVVSAEVETEVPAGPADLPKANVVRSAEYENVDLPWGSYGQWSPTPGLDSRLKAAYTFTCEDTAEEAAASPYADWHCDFYVKLDRDLEANQIFLGGNYYPFEWVGFHNGNMALPANNEIPLLGSVAGAWTYAQVASIVGTFICGVGDVNDALTGATFTVMLRLTNPDDESESYNVSTIDYTFTAPTEVDKQDGLSAALASGGIVELAAGEYTMPSFTAGSTVEIVGTKNTVIDVTKGAYCDNATVSFKGVTIKTGTGKANGNGSDYAALYSPNVTYTNCTFVGPMRVGRDGAKFINCTFTELGNDYVWTYGNDVTFEGCTFNTAGKAILIYSDGGSEVSEVSVTGCTFNATAGAKAGAITNQNCAAIEIHNYGNGVNLTTSDNTVDEEFSGEWRIKTYETGRTQVFVNGTEYTRAALDGKLMTIDGTVATVIG